MVLALEVACNQAVQQREGKAVEPLLGNELIYIDDDGTVMNKGQSMASVRSSALHAGQVTNESMKVQVHAASAVVVGVYCEKGSSAASRTCTASDWLTRGYIATARGHAWPASRR